MVGGRKRETRVLLYPIAPSPHPPFRLSRTNLETSFQAATPVHPYTVHHKPSKISRLGHFKIGYCPALRTPSLSKSETTIPRQVPVHQLNNPLQSRYRWQTTKALIKTPHLSSSSNAENKRTNDEAHKSATRRSEPNPAKMTSAGVTTAT